MRGGLRLVERFARVAPLGRLQDDESFAERGAQRIDRADLPVRKLLAQLVRRDHGGLIRAADAGGHADIENVAPLRQQRLHVFDVALRRDLRGVDLRTVAQLAVIVRAVEGVGVKADELLVINVIGEGDDAEILFPRESAGEIGGGIGNDCVVHSRILF